MPKKFKHIIFIFVALLIGIPLLFFVISRQKIPANKQQTEQSSLKVTV